MFGNKKQRVTEIDPEKIGKVDSIIGQDSTFTGNLESMGTIRIDGRFKGDIKTKGDVFIGAKAMVEGNIQARNIFLGGQVIGDIKADGRVELNAAAKLHGALEVGYLIIEEGAVFKGSCVTHQAAAAESPSEKETPKKRETSSSQNA